MNTTTTALTATAITGPARLDFLPKLFNEQSYLYGERAVFEWMRRLCQDYNGGYWEYYKVSNGAYFMAPRRPEPVRLQWALNWSDETVSPMAAGIVVTLFGIYQILESFPDDDMAERYRLLCQYAYELPESRSIMRLID